MYWSVLLSGKWTTDTLFILLRTPLFWWMVVFLLFYIIEKFDLGTHCFSWAKKYKTDVADSCGSAISCEEDADTESDRIQQLSYPDCMEVDKSEKPSSLVLQNGHVPVGLHTFVRCKLIPTFSSHSIEGNPHFSVLVLSNIPSEQKIKRVRFRQVTFNGVPLVDPNRVTYPQSYRYENYIVARPSESEHAEALILKEVKSLVKAYGVKERCYLRTPVPQFGLLYSLALPCTECVKLVARILPKICSQKFVLVYSEENSEKRSTIQENIQILKNSGIMVVKIPK